LLVWDLLAARLGFRKQVRRSRPARLGRMAANFRLLAADLGGVMIKVGQFLSARADVLPIEITDQLEGLQDEVPPAAFEDIRRLAEAELGGRLESRYSSFEETPLAAASLGQVHRARLNPADAEANGRAAGLDVVVKIQRPDIESVIATDLSALRTVSGWLMRYRPIRRRVDVPALLAEFTRVLYEEIDYIAEGGNADAFAKNFEDFPEVRIPAVVWTHTTRRVLTLEDVYAVKITDYAGITRAGISRAEVAKRVFDLYLQQIFEDGFFHADPHPGNLFVEPGEPDENGADGWRLTFVDFGMVGHVPANMRDGLRELAIGVGTKDAERMVKSYQMMNVLLPGADLELLAKAEAKAFERFWGKSMDELRQIDMRQMHDFAREFREIVFSMPFQVPQDLVFLVRTVAILSGICTGLDPDFNVWENLAPFAQQLLSEKGGRDWEFWLAEAGAFVQTLAAIPPRLERVLGKMERDELAVRTPRLERQLQYVEVAVRRGSIALLFLALLSNGVFLYLGGEYLFSYVLLGGAVFALAVFILARPKRR